MAFCFLATDHLPLKLHATAKGYVAIFDTKKTDKETLEGRLKNNRWRQQKSQPINWKPYYCVLLQDDRSFTHFPTEEMSIGERLFLELPRVRLDGGRQAFRRRWGYDMGVPSVPEEDEDSSELSETTPYGTRDCSVSLPWGEKKEKVLAPKSLTDKADNVAFYNLFSYIQTTKLFLTPRHRLTRTLLALPPSLGRVPSPVLKTVCFLIHPYSTNDLAPSHGTDSTSPEHSRLCLLRRFPYHLLLVEVVWKSLKDVFVCL
ncbi:uncharacterized protein TNIN_7131 [Trichonephila inaurata madagascariensis]|uniref:Uncharacterized protein n=1 Tax=Trichonephila inaurata madagascariensis TaxID=2747483 RepID=A0A8X6YMR7_9ARAC|nr:uncharacterized protein TNIN_7131 [Trichonephila inaurata madagascariensis]